MAESTMRRIILLGKTGVGKSSLANTIFGEELFQVDHSFNSGKSECQAETRFISERNITLIDTPGFFDTDRSEEEMKSEIVRCIIESAPGPHALVIVLKVERFTKQEQAVIDKICQHFSEDVLKYATVVFTHGDQLPEGMKIEQYVSDSEGLSNLMEKCGGRCHVVDNKYWKKNQQDEYRSNQVQVTELLKTIDKIVKENNKEYFINATLQEMEGAIQEEEERIKKSSGNKSQEEIRKQAKSNVFKKHVDKGLRKWIIGVVGFAVIAGLIAALSAVFISSKSAKVSGEEAREKDDEDREPTKPGEADADVHAAEEGQQVVETFSTKTEDNEELVKLPEVVQSTSEAHEKDKEVSAASEPGVADADVHAAEEGQQVVETFSTKTEDNEELVNLPEVVQSTSEAHEKDKEVSAASEPGVADADVHAAEEGQQVVETFSTNTEDNEELGKLPEVVQNTSEAIINDLFENAYDNWNLFV